MLFEWDEKKRLSNIEKHNLDFYEVWILFSLPHLLGRANSSIREDRWMATGLIEGVLVTVIFTYRGDAIRVISMRGAGRGERERYRQLFD